MSLKFPCYRISIFIFLSVNICLASENTSVDLIDDTGRQERSPLSPSEKAEVLRLGKFLDALFANCGRYPKTHEGLKALVSKPETLDCSKWGIQTKDGGKPYLRSVPKGWKYTSENGSSYTIELLKRKRTGETQNK